MPDHSLMSLNIPDHGWMLLTVPEYAKNCLKKLSWIKRINYASVFNTLRYSYNKIIILTEDIMLEFLSAPYILPVAMLPFYL